MHERGTRRARGWRPEEGEAWSRVSHGWDKGWVPAGTGGGQGKLAKQRRTECREEREEARETRTPEEEETRHELTRNRRTQRDAEAVEN